MTNKLCGGCQDTLGLPQFSKNKSSKDGYQSQCKNCMKIMQQKWSDANPDYHKHKSKEWQVRRNKHCLEYQKQYYIDNREKVLERQRQYTLRNRHRITVRQREYKRNNIGARMASNLRNSLWYALKGKTKGGSAITNLGCSLDELKIYLEGKFQPGMSWNNYGKWHIDHIRPLCAFDLTDPGQVKQVCNYVNLQPLWAEDNLRKGGQI